MGCASDSPPLIRRLRKGIVGGALLLLAVLPVTGRADTVASLLGNFTINQYCGLRLADNVVGVRYTVIFGQLPALRELHAADTDGNGVTSQGERDAYAERLGPAIAEALRVTVDGVPIPLTVTQWATSLPTEQGGFSLRMIVDFSGTLPPGIASGDHKLEFTNQNYAGRFGWQEIVVEATPPTKVYATDAFSTSLTAGLTEAVAAMPASGPLNERSIHLRFTQKTVSPGETLLHSRSGAAPTASIAAVPPNSDNSEGAWLQRETRRLVGLISNDSVAPHIAILAILAATILGALHAFSPGHGKTVVGAYLIGSRATPRHALFLGITVTITHTLGVFALGFATLFASRYVVPERLIPILSLVSGLLVLGMGIALLAQRWRAAREALAPTSKGRDDDLPKPRGAVAFRPVPKSRSLGKHGHGLTMAFAGGHAHHAHDHADAHSPDGDGHVHDGAGHSHAGGVMHSHGGRMHSHLPPDTAGGAVTWRSLLALGISGGLVPCPSAMVLLLAAVALNKTAYGLLLVVAFSIGLAATLIAVGLAFLYARSRIIRPAAGARWVAVLPMLSAVVITLVGAMLCYAAVAGGPF